VRLTQHRLRIAALLLAIGGPVHAQRAATVPASSGIYDRLESVSAYFPVAETTLGERGLSRREIERIVARLSAAIDSSPRLDARQRWARAEIDVVAAQLRDPRGVMEAPRGIAAASWRADLFSSNAPSQRIEGNGLGEIDAVSNPFAGGRHGWPAVQGTIATVAPTFVAGTRASLAAGLQLQSSLTSVREGGWTAERLVNRAYLRGVYRNVALQVGAEELRWGQSPIGALFISGTAPPMPGIAVATDTAIRLPWLLRYAGPFRMTLMVADLGGTQDPPHAKLAGWQATIHPWSRFELGVAVLTHTGGEGGPPATFLEHVVDLFPVIDALAPQHADLQISNKVAGGNLRLRFPELSGLDLYYELQIDDFDGRRLRSSLTDDSGHLLGMRLPLLVGDDQFVWRAEWHRTSLRLYEHAQFRSGLTYRSRLIGNPLGPHAAAGHLAATWRWSPLNSVGISLADERRDPAQYVVVIAGDRDRGFQFVRTTDDPDYRRRRAAAVMEHALPAGALRLLVGYNRDWRTGMPARGDWGLVLSLTSHRLAAF
jgi:hypothetical protein